MLANEEKAREIAKKNAIIYDAEEDTANGLIYPTIHSTEECEKSALEMAEWKDQQFKKIFDELVNKTQHEVGLHFRDYLQRHNDYSALAEDWIRKRTRESMEENINNLLKEN